MPSDKDGMRNRLPLPLTRPATALCVALTLALALAACGSSSDDSESFSQSYNHAIAKLDQAGQALAVTQSGPKAHSSRAIARQLDRFAALLADTGHDLGRLQAPKAASNQYSALTRALDQAIASARRAARAARQIQPAAQRAALKDLRDDVIQIARAQDQLQHAINAG
jgi:hypothetical protein